MKKIVLGSVLVALAMSAVAAVSQPSGVHVPVPHGWTAVDQEYRYGRDDLWEYINGAAELFLTYKFRELVVADFEQGDDALTVSVYDMGSPLDAYGVFETEKPAEAEALAQTSKVEVLEVERERLRAEALELAKRLCHGAGAAARDGRERAAEHPRDPAAAGLAVSRAYQGVGTRDRAHQR